MKLKKLLSLFLVAILLLSGVTVTDTTEFIQPLNDLTDGRHTFD